MSTNKSNVGPVMAPGGVDTVVTIEQPVALSQYFHTSGSHFFYFNSGYVTGALTLTEYLAGWACTPVSIELTTSIINYWLSNAATPYSRVPCILASVNPGCVFRVPTTAAGGLSVQARVGECVDLVGVNDGTAQYVTPGTSTQDILICVGVDPDGDTNACLVTFNPEEQQQTT